MNYWILKSEPAAYSWATFLKEKKTSWNGVRNYQARNNLSKMKVGDLAFFYHSGEERRIVGIARVSREAHPDNLTEDPRWVMVNVEPIKALNTPVELGLIKEIPELQNIKMVRQSRLSVSELSKKEFELILALGNTKL